MERFVGLVEANLARKDWDALAAMMRFPLQVNSADGQGGPTVRFRVTSREEFLRRAPNLLASAGERSVARAAGSAPSCRAAQVGVAGGMIWATAFHEGLAITSVDCRGCAESEERQAVELDCLAIGRRYVLRRLDGARWLEVSIPSDPAAGVVTGRVRVAWTPPVGGRLRGGAFRLLGTSPAGSVHGGRRHAREGPRRRRPKCSRTVLDAFSIGSCLR